MKHLIRRGGEYFCCVMPDGDVYTHDIKKANRFEKQQAEKMLKNPRRFVGCEMIEADAD